MTKIVPLPNSYWVVPGRFLAGEHPVEISEEDTTTRLTALLDAGIRTFVNLTQVQEKMQNYSQLLRTMAAGRQVDVEIRRIPILDRSAPSPDTVSSILDLIDASVSEGKPVFVHCFAGIGRTGTIVGCYLQRHGNATAENVIAKISELRSLMPYGGEPSPHTPEQIELVRNWKAGS
jgi:protein-tyrosine phosphatase